MNGVYDEMPIPWNEDLNSHDISNLHSLDEPHFLKAYCQDEPDDSEGWIAQGLFWFNNGQLEEARDCFAVALEKDPKSARVLWLNAWLADHFNNQNQCHDNLKNYLLVAGSDSLKRRRFARKRILNHELLKYKHLISKAPKTKKFKRKNNNKFMHAVSF